MENFICIAKFKSKPGQYENLEARLKDLVGFTKLEEGCIDYDLCYTHGGDFDFFVVERYKSKNCFDVHSKQEYISRFFQDMNTLVEVVSVHVSENTKVAV